ncbi:putative pentatricopeptide repeat-containing protein At1g10330 [Bidens hawaiensis]|uniref:putative pentatricopeptide repeat-containing protein At1g10330 n=1 Tax=Bidens hawaiensis TaxID=980011 RepID=UPI00404A1E02
MLPSPESLLQLLQRLIKSPTQIKQIHSILITNGNLSTPNPSSVQWTTTLFYNTLIRAYLNIHLPHKTLILFTHMLSHNIPPNSHTFSSIVKAAASCSNCCLTDKPFYGQAMKRGVLADPFVQTSFIHLYAESGNVCYARKVFDEMREPCIVAYNAILDGLCKNGDMYSGFVFFNSMPMKDVYSWTCVINGYVKKERYHTAINVFQRMIIQLHFDDCVVKPNEATFVSILSACANITGVSGLLYGKQIHGYIIKNENRISAFVGTALINLYGKTDGLEYGTKVFKTLVNKEVCTWNAIIGSLASNGKEKEALNMFDKMKAERRVPNEVTFVAILTACARAGLVKSGLQIFNSVLPRFGVVPQMEHYGCVVDMLGRAGFLQEAKEFMGRMPFEPDASVLGALLGACKLHGAVDIGSEVAKRLYRLEPQQCGQYILLSSIYADVDKWEHATSLRYVMVDGGYQKPPAYSTVNVL